MESGDVQISRASGSCIFPANFTLVAAMNPCPCGFYGSQQRECRCTQFQIQKYRNKISGPLLDRIDIHLDVAALSPQELNSNALSESTEGIRQRVDKARQKQIERYASAKSNSEIKSDQLRLFCHLNSSARKFLEDSIYKLQLSARAYDRILRIARSIADLEGEEEIQFHHLAEAIQYRSLDRKLW